MKEERKAKEQLNSYLCWPIIPAVLAAAAAGAAFCFSARAGAAAAVCALISIVCCLRLYLFERKHILQAMLTYAVSADELKKRLADDLDIPYALLSQKGEFVWKNRSMRTLFREKGVSPAGITAMFPEVGQEELNQLGESGDFHVELSGVRFRARLVRTGIATDRIFALFLYDETEMLSLKEELDSTRLTAGLIYLDNYDETLESIDEVRRSLFAAMIDRKIVRYFDSMHGIIKKLEKDKYFFILEHRYLEEMEGRNFDLLEQIKTVNIGNEMRVTISIGVGEGGSGPDENQEYARLAIEMALGRGGDQAVVKEQESVRYYGGKSNSKEKTTRVKARVKAHAFRELIENRDTLFIMGHRMMDIDSLGAAVGIWRIAASMGKTAHIVVSAVNSAVEPVMERFRGGEYPADMFVQEEEALEMADDSAVLVIVDTNRPSMVEAPKLLDRIRTIVVLDHHRQSADSIRGAALSYVETYASSACEMVSEIVQYISDDIRLRAVEADAMYAGIVIDTHNFLNQTGVRTFEAAAFLRRNGADVTRVRKLFRDKPEDSRAKADAVHNAEIYKGAFAISRCEAEGLDSPTVVGAQAANDLLDIDGVKASIVLTRFNGLIFVSARSIDEVNVQVLMEKLGGGGHRTVAGAQLKDMTVEEAELRIREILDEMTEKGEIE